MVAIGKDREARMLMRKQYRSSIKDTAEYLESPTTMPLDSEELYRRINKVEREIGGDAGIIGMSGSVARLDLARIFRSMGLESSSHFLDIGSGLGRPMLHALQVGAAQVSGIEFDIVKHKKSQTVVDRILPIWEQTRTCLHHGDVLTLKSLTELDTNITHVFSFWEGITMDAREAIGKLVSMNWLKQRTVSTIAFVQSHVEHPDSYMKELCFPTQLKLVESFPVTMIGSAAKFKAYIFKLPPKRDDCRNRMKQSKVSLVSTPSGVIDGAHKPINRVKSARTSRQLQASAQALEDLKAIALLPDEIVLGDCIVRKRRLRSTVETLNSHPGISGVEPVHCADYKKHSAKRKKAPIAQTLSSTMDAGLGVLEALPGSPRGKQENTPCTTPRSLNSQEKLAPLIASSSSDLIDLSSPGDLTTPVILRCYSREELQTCEVINISPNELLQNEQMLNNKTSRELTPDSPVTRTTSIFDSDLRSRSCSVATTSLDEPIEPSSLLNYSNDEGALCTSPAAITADELVPVQTTVSLADLDIQITHSENGTCSGHLDTTDMQSQISDHNRDLHSTPQKYKKPRRVYKRLERRVPNCPRSVSIKNPDTVRQVCDDQETPLVCFPPVAQGRDRAELIKSFYG